MQYPDLPESCPECDRKFSTIARPKSQFSKQGWSLLFLAATINVVWVLLLVLVMVRGGAVVVPVGGRGVIFMAVILLAPSLVLGGLALQCRVVKLRCLGLRLVTRIRDEGVSRLRESVSSKRGG